MSSILLGIALFFVVLGSFGCGWGIHGLAGTVYDPKEEEESVRIIVVSVVLFVLAIIAWFMS